MNEEELYKRGFNRKPLRCLAKGEVVEVLFQAHNIEHHGASELYKLLLDMGYYWPKMEVNCTNHV